MMTIIEIPTAGRYVWWPALSVVAFIEHGRRRASRELQLDQRQNTWAGAVKKAAIDIQRHSNIINKERVRA